MVTKNQIKLIKSLHQKKYRKQYKLFIAEGIKVIRELVNSSLEVECVYCTEEIDFEALSFPKKMITTEEMKKISALITVSNCLGIFKIPEVEKPDYSDLILALDDIRDPGNLGTIIRLCDWFGIKNIFCTEETVDVYNPKVVQATMGSLSRVNIVYGNLHQMINETKNLPVYGTFMEGKNIYKQIKLPQKGIIVMGNEANGISDSIQQLITERLTIPRFGDLQQTESLNVAMAASIVLSEFRRINF
ncbi:TrmH family RNA methyltransferase [Myroides indicus]|uniref:TrmH family RNA methyltransferase n=1 Tax=Myroides indicus TaxID=1323422 RepID=A0A4R7EQM7_9FLAO|nr:RNA methyltransferase [Myroides indicus]TDS54562.1 TrmH family RNA methyltransferase [Myroides indicus]